MSPDHPAHEANRVAKAIRFAQVLEAFEITAGTAEALDDDEWRTLADSIGEAPPSEACKGAIDGILRSKALAPISTEDLFARLNGGAPAQGSCRWAGCAPWSSRP